MSPWIDRKVLIKNARDFVRAHGYFLKKNGARIANLVEIAVYNSIVQFYKTQGFTVTGANLGPKKSFRYKLTATGLIDNYSYFKAERDGSIFYILHNIRIQSAHHDHLYFTGDVVVANKNGATTQPLKNGRRHSFVAKENLTTFAEVKHLNPFPEVLYNFMGLVLEFMPGFVDKKFKITNTGVELSPIIAFTGPGSEHAEKIHQALEARYGINIIFSTSTTFGALTGFAALKRYATPPPVQFGHVRRRFAFIDDDVLDQSQSGKGEEHA